MNYALFHIFPAVFDVYSVLRYSVQPAALKVMDGIILWFYEKPFSYVH